MNARDVHQPAGTGARGRSSRTERRREERAHAQTRKHRSQTQSTRFALFAGLATIVVAGLVFGAALLRQSAGSTSGGAQAAMVDRTALNPAVSLLKTGSVAPNFTVKDAAGRPVSLRSLRGHPVLLEFFAVWCPVCHREAPAIRTLTAQYGSRGLRTMAVLANPYGSNYEVSQGKDLTIASPRDLRWYRHTYRANYPLYVDSRFRAVNHYGAGSYPTIYVIDARGKVAYAHQGQIPRSVLSRTIAPLLPPQ